MVRFSARTDQATTASNTAITTNVGGAVYSLTRLRGTGSAAQSTRSSGQSVWDYDVVDAATSAANTFSSNEMYIPNYTAATYKPISYFAVQEDNATGASIICLAQLLSSSTAISSITIATSSGNFISGSSFYLYGI